MPPRAKGKSKKELLNEQIAAAVGAGREVAVETVDFSDPNRPKTCLEVDFPIIPINQIAGLEASSGALVKPIYKMSKWWARRPSSVFRSMLLAAAMKAPEDENKAAKAVWEVYYSNHQKRGALRHLKVADIFMGGGTTIVEGSRLGLQMFGCDLNPVAWFVVNNEMAQVDIAEVKRLLADIEAEVKPFIMPYYACDGPDGEKGKWFRRAGTKQREQKLTQSDLLGADMNASPDTEDDWEELPASFDIFSVPWQERRSYRYEGSEIIYTFWGKHGPCQREGCGHRTPIMSTPIVAIKTMTVGTWHDWECRGCGKKFDVERRAARMAPDVPLFVAADEKPFAVMDNEGRFNCPHCGKSRQDAKAAADNNSPELGEAKNKIMELTLLIHPQWLEGCPKCDEQGREYGGSATDSVEATIRWNKARAAKLRFLEVRGKLPEQVTCPETKVTFYTDARGGTVPKKSNFTCAACGTAQDVLEATTSAKSRPQTAAYVYQAVSRSLAQAGDPFGGRFFALHTDVRRLNAAVCEWSERRDSDLASYWPTVALAEGFKTTYQRIPEHGYPRYADMFNALQLLVHSQLLRAIKTLKPDGYTALTRQCVLGALQQFLRFNCAFTFWHRNNNQISAFLSNNNYHVKANTVETSVFCDVGDGSWGSAVGNVLEGLKWKNEPWDIVPNESLTSALPNESVLVLKGKCQKVQGCGRIVDGSELLCGSATDVRTLESSSVDLVITDPPFGNNVQYSELADFFYVWLRLALKDSNPAMVGELTPKALEAVVNPVRNRANSDQFYQRLLTDAWKECARILKASGILAFTFHHSEDEPWVGVLESLFDAGFYLEAAYPIRSDETKGEGAKPGTFGSQLIEYDIIHVCRKRMTEPQPISWARLRRQITDDVRRIKNLLSQHQKEGLPAADLQVIKRGKALEYFSRHYGKVYVEQGREFTIREALVGINTLLDDDTSTAGGPEAPPPNAEPYTRQFFRLFYETTEVPRDQMQKFLRGTGIAPSDFEDRGWCSEKNKIFTLTPPVEMARAWKGTSRKGMARDFDQTMFLVGGCVEGSGIRVNDTLNSPNYAPHPATVELVEWLCRHGGTPEIKHAAQRARTIYREWLAANKGKVQEQMRLFDLEA